MTRATEVCGRGGDRPRAAGNPLLPNVSRPRPRAPSLPVQRLAVALVAIAEGPGCEGGDRRSGCDRAWRRDPASRITVPVLLIHGGADTDTPPAHSARVQAALKGPSELILVPGPHHNESLNDEAIWTRIDEQIARVLRLDTPSAQRRAPTLDRTAATPDSEPVTGAAKPPEEFEALPDHERSDSGRRDHTPPPLVTLTIGRVKTMLRRTAWVGAVRRSRSWPRPRRQLPCPRAGGLLHPGRRPGHAFRPTDAVDDRAFAGRRRTETLRGLDLHAAVGEPRVPTDVQRLLPNAEAPTSVGTTSSFRSSNRKRGTRPSPFARSWTGSMPSSAR